MKKPVQLTEKVFLIDDYDLNIAERTGTYVLMEEETTLIETSASPSVPRILEGLEALGVSPKAVKYIIVTHIHLDHAGGAGLLLTHCPEAKVIVHPKGARHLADPSRLIAGAKAVYGERFDELFDPILAVPEERLVVKGDGERLKISKELELEFFDTPGHANHHFSIYHSESKGMFTGDTAGIFYSGLKERGIDLYLPSTSPNQFDPDKMRASIDLYKEKKVERIFFGHYGMSEQPSEVFAQVDKWLDIFLEEAKNTALRYEGNDLAEEMAKNIFARIKAYLTEKGLVEDHPIYELLHLDASVSAMGLAMYLEKN